MTMEKKEKGSGNGLSFVLSNIFLILTAFGVYMFYGRFMGISTLRDVGVFEFVLLSLAVFRLTRLFVYDSVSQWIRDIFLDTKEETVAGVVYVIRSKPQTGIRRLFTDLLGCPWCVGVWISLFAVFIYFMWPITWFFWLLLAVAGTSSFIQILANQVGWSAEYGKLSVKKLEK